MATAVQEALRRPGNPFFTVSRREGRYATGLKESYYSSRFPDEEFSFDVGNNKVLANIDATGAIKRLVIYRGCYCVDDIPGVWMAKDFYVSGPFSFALRFGGGAVVPGSDGGDFEASLLENIFPRVTHSLHGLNATLVAFAPVSRDGGIRLRGLVYGMSLDNVSSARIEGSIVVPAIAVEGRDPYAAHDISIYPLEGFGENRDETPSVGEIPFALAPGESLWVSVLLGAPGDECALVSLRSRGAAYWLAETIEYHRSMTGRLVMPEDPLTASIFERAVFLCANAVGKDDEGRIVGSNWGSSPATRQTWMKDMYYSLLPFAALNPALFREGMLWFLANGIRPRGSRFSGGISHSLSNSLSSVVMAGMYYELTDDKAFFRANRGEYEAMKSILESVLRSRAENDPWLFPSTWISDAYSLGRYHTGSNIIAWKAFDSFARIAGEACGDKGAMRRYRDVAARIKADVEKHMTVEGPFGRQLLEGIGGLDAKTKTTLPVSWYGGRFLDSGMQFLTDVRRGDSIDLMMHDGEESDTTLLSVYGMEPYDNALLRNYVTFAMSSHNPTHGEQCRGIRWGSCSGATFPGYTTGFAGVVDAESMNGERGFMSELKRLCDLDGSWWWWPYRVGAATGDVCRNFTCGKCGWAAGVFVSLFVSEILGIRFDAPSRRLSLRPFSPCSGYRWEDARIGSLRATIGFTRGGNRVECLVENHDDRAIDVGLSLPVDEEREYRVAATKGRCENRRPAARFLGRPALEWTFTVRGGESRTYTID